MEDLDWVNRTSLHGLRFFREKMLWLIDAITSMPPEFPHDPERVATMRRQVAACEKRIAALEGKTPQDSEDKSN